MSSPLLLRWGEAAGILTPTVRSHLRPEIWYLNMLGGPVSGLYSGISLPTLYFTLLNYRYTGPTCLPVYLSTCIPVHPVSICLFVKCLSVCFPVSICLPVFLSFFPVSTFLLVNFFTFSQQLIFKGVARSCQSGYH